MRGIGRALGVIAQQHVAAEIVQVLHAASLQLLVSFAQRRVVVVMELRLGRR